jgi:AcrR family transcriptional regulator
MGDLALEADVSVSSLYNLIGGRDDVIRAVSLSVLEELDEAFVHVEATDPLDRAYELLNVLIDVVTGEVPRPVLLAALADVQMYGEVAAGWRSSGALADAIQSMVAAGMLSDDLSVTVIAKQVLWTHTGYLRQWAAGRFDETELRAAVLYSLDLCLLAVATSAVRDRLLNHARSLEAMLRRL